MTKLFRMDCLLRGRRRLAVVKTMPSRPAFAVSWKPIAARLYHLTYTTKRAATPTVLQGTPPRRSGHRLVLHLACRAAVPGFGLLACWMVVEAWLKR